MESSRATLKAGNRPAILRARASDSSSGTPSTFPASISSRRRPTSVFHAPATDGSILPCRAAMMRSINSATTSAGISRVCSTISLSVIGMVQLWLTKCILTRARREEGGLAKNAGTWHGSCARCSFNPKIQSARGLAHSKRFATSSVLFVAESLNGVESRGFEGREEAGEETDGGAEAHGHGHGHRRDDRGVGAGGDQLQHLDESIRSHHAQRRSEQGDDGAFDEDLDEDGQAGGANGL